MSSQISHVSISPLVKLVLSLPRDKFYIVFNPTLRYLNTDCNVDSLGNNEFDMSSYYEQQQQQVKFAAVAA